MDRNDPAINRILEEAANLVRRCKETAGNVEQTKGYKGRPIERLKEFATIHHLWINLHLLSLVFLSKGGDIHTDYQTTQTLKDICLHKRVRAIAI